ncbi:hypothetical protein EVAR_102017_1 [Eumeta japonica]|uniref:Uncharacterized protein n=1 Tax=Eumeta variegata TaxID=151549 RepID=A0A4C1TZI4_EUMVA|nr:hypothetical protein EVAR_102017_1 [Eumeta japonica]
MNVIGEFTTILCCLFGSSRELSKNIGECSTHLRASQVSGSPGRTPKFVSPETGKSSGSGRAGRAGGLRCGASAARAPDKILLLRLEGGVLLSSLP